jgi:hypothetical protein
MRTKLLGERWHICARSGFAFPESQMSKNKNGNWIANRFLDPEDSADFIDPQENIEVPDDNSGDA